MAGGLMVLTLLIFSGCQNVQTEPSDAPSTGEKSDQTAKDNDQSASEPTESASQPASTPEDSPTSTPPTSTPPSDDAAEPASPPPGSESASQPTTPPPSTPPAEEPTSPPPAAEPEVKSFTLTAKQWSWEPSTITVKKGDTVKLTITSIDVPHGFSLPDYGINQTVEAGQTTTVQFTADKTGTFTFACSIFCGEGHSDMKGTLIVE